jgi:LPS export ABC transporter protein LptC
VDRKSIFLALFIFIIIVFSLYFTVQENPVIPPEPAVENKNLPEAEMQDVSFSIFNENQKQELKLQTQELKNFKSQNRMELRPIGLKVYSFNEEQLLYKLTGDYGVYYNSRDYIEIRGNVVVESDSYHIRADELDYNLSRNYLEGRGSVTIRGNNFNSKAESFNSDLNLRDLKLSGNKKQAEIYFDELRE